MCNQHWQRLFLISICIISQTVNQYSVCRPVHTRKLILYKKDKVVWKVLEATYWFVIQQNSSNFSRLVLPHPGSHMSALWTIKCEIMIGLDSHCAHKHLELNVEHFLPRGIFCKGNNSQEDSAFFREYTPFSALCQWGTGSKGNYFKWNLTSGVFCLGHLPQLKMPHLASSVLRMDFFCSLCKKIPQ